MGGGGEELIPLKKEKHPLQKIRMLGDKINCCPLKYIASFFLCGYSAPYPRISK
jgi:hypothetical protein